MKPGLHPRNRHLGGYDFTALALAVPALSHHLITTPSGETSVDFANPVALKMLNRALLETSYGIQAWDIPKHYLCPPIPGRADVLHHLADLLADGDESQIPFGSCVSALDIGVGANGIYPLVGHAEYGWNFVGVDIDQVALNNVQRILDANPAFQAAIKVRHQPVFDNLFVGVLRRGEYFDVTLCNPPFFGSPDEARQATERKSKNLGKGQAAQRNFGGQNNELWYPGGERSFVQGLIEQSAGIRKRCLWFTTLVSKADHLPLLQAALAKFHPADVRVIPMSQGQKQSRILAWTFLGKADRKIWAKRREAKMSEQGLGEMR